MSSLISNLRPVATSSSFGKAAETSAVPLQAGYARKAQIVPRFSDLELKNMGREILELYKGKVLDKDSRSLVFSFEGHKYRIEGRDIENILIHTDKGIVQLGHDGMPRPNQALPIADRQEMTVALMRTLATLRDVDNLASPAAGQPPAA